MRLNLVRLVVGPFGETVLDSMSIVVMLTSNYLPSGIVEARWWSSCRPEDRFDFENLARQRWVLCILHVA